MAWESAAEAELYQQTVRDNPRREGEGPLAYTGRIADLVAEVLRGHRPTSDYREGFE